MAKLSCKDIAALATEYAEGALEPETARRFEVHLAACGWCQDWVAQLRLTSATLGALPPPELPPALAAELERRFATWQEERAPVSGEVSVGRRASAAIPAVAVAGAAAALAGLARNPSRAPRDWLLGLGLAGVAVSLAAVLGRLTPGFAVAAVSAAFVAALAAGGQGVIGAAAGIDCLLTLAGMAVGAAALAWLVLRREPGPARRAAAAGWAVAGALAGDAGLQVGCGHHGSLAHLLAVHTAGVVAVAAVAWLLARPRLAR